VKVQDAVGAGDAFTAAMVSGLIRMKRAQGGRAELQVVLTKACALGALVASLPGAQPAFLDFRFCDLRFSAATGRIRANRKSQNLKSKT
jgi:sugar/nucleoside kinase (ribokinase family)